AVGVVPALARIGRRRAVQQAPGLELLGLEQAAGLADEVVDVGPRILFDLLYRARLGAEHLLQRLAVEIVARRFGARRVRLDQDAHAPFLRHADPLLHQARGGDFLVAYGFQALRDRAGVGSLDVLRPEEALDHLERGEVRAVVR